MKGHSEEAYEALIEEHLVAQGGYEKGSPGAYDQALALMPEDLLAFVQRTQPKLWDKQAAIHGGALGKTLLAAFDKATKGPKGVLDVIRHGFKFYGATVRVAAFQPAHGLNPEVEEAYRANVLRVVRQVHHDPKLPKDSTDLVLFLNGIPVVTAELKNAMTSQTASHARQQYRERDPDAPLFQFKRRALVHFAVGSDEVYMTTQLERSSTHFLPFNRGHGTGAGNPPAEGKHRTHYLWEEVWQRDSLLDVIARFLHLQIEEKVGADGRTRRSERLIFPRYHQLDCVRKIVGAAKVHGAGKNYLVQHSAGSGKTNTIAWLAYRLASLHDEADRKIYDGVVVISDRRVLDSQLQDTIYQFDHKQGVVQKIDEHSRQLAEALSTGVSIVITTIHKFGFVTEVAGKLKDKRYAVIVDEAHSSQSGDMATNMKSILASSSIAKKFEEEADDVDVPDQAALRAAITRGHQANISFFAFTATPKHKTLELFGHKGPDGKAAAFHLYSMRQAIEEGFILDVLKGYTTYKRYFKLVKSVADDPELDKRKASRALARFVSLHPVNVAQKTEVIVEHFRACVMNQLRGRAKAMVVTGSRLHAVKYKQAFDRYLGEKSYTDVAALVAFSGEVRDPDDPTTKDKPYTEPQMNRDPVTGKPLKEKELPAAFGGDRYNVLIVANKYQTGFDEPLLCAMYVDKRLAGIQAVQTLSRLNRTTRGKEQTFVLDFVNEREEILESFQTYYEGAVVGDAIDPQRLYELSAELDATQIYHQAEVDGFARLFFKPQKDQRPADNARMNAALDPAVDRFRSLSPEEQDDFRGKLQAYVNLYAFLGQVVPFHDIGLEKLYAFAKMLLRKIPAKGETSPAVELGEDVALHYYRLQKEAEGDLLLAAEGEQPLYGATATGTRESKDDKVKLSTIIDLVNDRFATDFDAQDLIDGVKSQLIADDTVRKAAQVNDRANFDFVGKDAFDDALIERHAKHGAFIDRVFADKEVLEYLRAKVLDQVYEEVTRDPER